jgi:trans-2,3-dihydro-3-hydroxyanthranilate isomerase
MTPDDLRFDIVDVFAERPYAGNQLAVVHGSAGLSDAQLLGIAREFGFSETTFPGPRDRSSYDVRIFTPGREIPFAGHPTLGTAWVLARRGELEGEQVVQHCGAGEVRVALRGEHVELAAAPRDLAGPLPDRVVEELLHDLGLAAADRDGDAWVAGAGLSFVHLPVTDAAVGRARPPRRPLPDYDGLPATGDPLEGVNLVAVDGTDVHARVFVPGLSVAEDPATGSAAAGLGMMLAASGRLPDGGGYTIRQGGELGRPSRLEGHVEASAGRPTSCRVRGRVHGVAQGSLRVPPA